MINSKVQWGEIVKPKATKREKMKRKGMKRRLSEPRIPLRSGFSENIFFLSHFDLKSGNDVLVVVVAGIGSPLSLASTDSFLPIALWRELNSLAPQDKRAGQVPCSHSW